LSEQRRKSFAGWIVCGLIAAALALCVVLRVWHGSPGNSPGGDTPDAGTNAVLRPASGGELILISPGEFRMGQEGGPADESPHTVWVGSFYMDRDLVTQELYQGIMGVNPSKQKGPQNPVERVQWTDAARFCNKCSERDGLTPCYDLQTWECRFAANGYRLPTEAEWEYACRAGTSGQYYFGDNPAKAPQFAWFKPHSEGMAHPVGRKLANPWGLNDMLGNVWEWCNDWYGEAYYQQSPRENPLGPATGKQRVLRGGAWDCPIEKCTAASRSKEFPVFTDACFGADTYGFRRVRSSAPAPEHPSAGSKIEKALPTAPPTQGQGNVAESPAAPNDAAAVKKPSPGSPAAAGGKLQLSQLKGTIVFVSDRTGTLNIFSMRADGSDQKPLTAGKEPHADPRFSPDGKSILYTVLRGGFPEIWGMNRDGTAQRKLALGCQADWSPDGRRIVFIRDNQVWLREISSGQERRVSPAAWERCGVPAWRPDGRQLAVASRHTGSVGIYLLGVDGTGSSLLATEEESCTPCWSRDGGRLLCQTVKGHIHQVGADGRNWEQVTDGADVQHDARYSPDGSMIVFCRAPSAEGPWKICIARLGDESMDFVEIPAEGSNLQPDWK
jgi:formylglycine-generating enzyme required for sulfatase activity